MTNYWIGGANGDWFADANWSEGKAPPSKGWVDVLAGKPDGSAVTINVAQANATQITTLKVGSNATLNVTATSPAPGATAFYANSLTVAQGGTMLVDTSSTVNLGSNPTVNGTLQISGNPAISINSNSVGGTGTLILDQTTLGSSNAQFQMGSSLTTVLQNGASLYVNNATAGGRIVFGRDAVNSAPSQLIFADYNQTVSTPITGYDAASVITIGHGGTPPISATFVANSSGTYTLKIAFDHYNNGITLSNISFGPNSTPGTPTIVQNANGSWSVVGGATGYNGQICYLAGSMILTPEGECGIETLEAGDQVMVHENGTLHSRTILRVGHAHTTVGATGQADMDAVPVRIRAGALADGIPSRDLLVTPEHCMMLEGTFIPVRMLVNGMTIAYDHSITEYDYYHIETEKHAILIANGALSESFMDVGHRPDALMKGHQVARLHPLSWEKDAAAPLVTDRSHVEPIFAAIALRAQALGYADTQPVPSTKTKNTIHLVLEDGTTLYPIRTSGEHFVFMLPEGCQSVRILSQAARPADRIGPFVDDRRMLGVLVGDVTVWNDEQTQHLSNHLSDPYADGWWSIESSHARWTAGNARLDLGRTLMTSGGILSLHILSHGDQAAVAA
ncbi:Hint domain-containing protein [Gluconobacter cerevisiae]|uniref:Hint domain-containing protein n=1 Tax=Gluconobacter cerevisiae TaxID=1379734 RepID=A0ABR9YB65_9PROT|nr:Hint domain-containing protein [Gluconobacter cerevisiae]MBF0875892.1 Hint domain-containing protein [Gluconobacter cerevisiae]